MKSKQNAAHPKAGAKFYQPTLTYSFSSHKKTSEIIDADALQTARFARSRPAIFTEIIIA